MLCALCGSRHDPAAFCADRTNGISRVAVADGNQPSPLADGTRLRDGQYVIESVQSHDRFVIGYSARFVAERRNVLVREFFPPGCRRKNHDVQPISELAIQKFLRARDLFLKHGHAVTQLRHPNLIVAHQCFAENNTAYLALDALSGRTLQDIVDESGALDEEKALYYIRQASQGLEEMHRAGLLHGNIQPSHVLICAAAENGATNGKSFFSTSEDEVVVRRTAITDRVVLTDFGRNPARSGHVPTVSASGALADKPSWGGAEGYAPIEQYLPDGLSPASDVYALGAMTYFLLTGATPPTAPNRARGIEVPPLHRVRGAISRATSDAVVWALEEQAADRPASVGEFLDHLPRHRPVTLPKPAPRAPLPMDADASVPREELLSALQAFTQTAATGTTTAPKPQPVAAIPTHKTAAETRVFPAPIQAPSGHFPAAIAPAIQPAIAALQAIHPRARPSNSRRRALVSAASMITALVVGAGLWIWNTSPSSIATINPPTITATPLEEPGQPDEPVLDEPIVEEPVVNAPVLREPSAIAVTEATPQATPAADTESPLSVRRRVVRRQIIPFSQRQRRTTSLPVGQQLEVRAGVAGVREITWEVVLSGEREVERRVVGSRIVRRPRARIVRLGIGRPAETSVPTASPRTEVADSSRRRDERPARDDRPARNARPRRKERIVPEEKTEEARPLRRRRRLRVVPRDVSNDQAVPRPRRRRARRREGGSDAPLPPLPSGEAGLPPL